MDPLSITASIIAVAQLTSTLLEYLNSVRDAPKDRAQCAIEASNLHNLLTVLRYRMEEPSSNEPWFIALKALGIRHGPLDQYRHALGQILEKTSGSSSARKLGSSLLWSFKKEDVKDLLVRIERLKTAISIALEMDHFKLSQAIKADMRTIQDGTEGIKVDTETIRKALPIIENKLDRSSNTHQGDRLSEISEWISSANFGPQHADFIARKQDGTGVWFLESPVVAAWLQGSSETLFCPGIPGAGKTMIAAITVDHLMRTVQSDSIEVAFIYCNYKNDVDVTATGLLASILKQLLSGQTSTPDQITGMYRRHKDRGTDPTLEDIFTALLSVLVMYSRTYIVIDALDECPNNKGARSQLIKSLRILQTKANLCLMITSRVLPDIQSEFASVLTLEITATDSDVQRFLKGQIHRLPKCIQRDEDLQSLVKARIAEAVDGMFLLARLYLDSLLDKRTKAKVRSTLQSLSRRSSALDDAYKGALERIEGQLPEDRALAKKVITWIVYAERPLLLDELCHALAVSVGDTDLDRDNIPDVADLISVCAGLVTLDEERDVIRLVHYTTQEFFERIGRDWCPDTPQMIASTCLTYLRINPFRSSPVPSPLYAWAFKQGMKSVYKRLHQYPFLAYAATFWGRHAVTVQEEVSGIALPFLLDAELVCPISGYGEGWTGVHLASFFGLEILLERLLQYVVKSTLGSNLSSGYTPLLLAIRQGHEAAVRVLLDHGVAANDGGWTRKPISYAAEAGREDIVKLLLSKIETDVNSLDQQMLILRRFAPLHYAVAGRHTRVVNLLLQDERVDANLRSMTGVGEVSHTALTLAVENNDIDMVRLLLAHKNVDPNAKGNGSSPLSEAASKGYREIVALLLEHPGIEPDLRDDCQRWKRGLALVQGIVQSVMGYPDVNVGDTPLSGAAAAGHSDIVKALLECGKPVNTNVQDSHGEPVLSTAVVSGHRVVVELLLDVAEIDPNIANKAGSTPLWIAALCGHDDLVGLLLACKGINPNSQDINGLTPLLVAAARGFVEIVKLLLECEDIDPNMPDVDGHTPLSAATSEGQEAVVSLLLECDKVNADLGGQPLLYDDMEERPGTLSGIIAILKYLAGESNLEDKEQIQIV